MPSLVFPLENEKKTFHSFKNGNVCLLLVATLRRSQVGGVLSPSVEIRKPEVGTRLSHFPEIT